MKTCKVCNKEFTISKGYGGNNTRTCSIECKKVNDVISRKETQIKSDNKVRNVLREYSNKHKIPIYMIRKYGIEFLNNNPMVLEVIQLQTKMSGRYTFLTEEEKLIRKRANEIQNNLRQRQKQKNKKL